MKKTIDINTLLDEVRELGGSDLHFTYGLPPIMRLHGSLVKLNKEFDLPHGEKLDMRYSECTEPIIIKVINDITIPKQKQIIARGEDADFAYVTESGYRNRVNVYRQQGYHAIALRLLRNDIPSLKQLMLPSIFGDFSLRPRGLVLVTGPTGSGKSTTLAAMVDHVNRQKPCHILTLEDPIEYRHTNKVAMVNQREINYDVDSFSAGLRVALREDPDVILVGEMRDFETISSAVTAAETGHLVFSTLHTIGAADTLDRIIDVYPPHAQGQCRAQLANSLVAIISQTLVPTADGKGRVCAYEVLNVNDACSSLIREGKTFQIPSMIATGSKNGMIALDQHLAKLTRSHMITREDALQKVKNKQEYERYLSSPGIGGGI